jgi:hypothetical protein
MAEGERIALLVEIRAIEVAVRRLGAIAERMTLEHRLRIAERCRDAADELDHGPHRVRTKPPPPRTVVVLRRGDNSVP